MIVHQPSITVFLSRFTVAFFTLVGAQQAAPHLGNQLLPQTQFALRQNVPAKTQRVTNPLNDLLTEAQHDIDSNQFEAAITPLQKFIAEKPDIAWAHFQLAYAYTALKRTDGARTEYERAIALDPNMPEARLNLGILLLDVDPAAAVPHLRKAVDLLPTQSRPRFLLGTAQQRAGDLAAAADSWEGALRLDPRDLQTLTHLAELYFSQKKFADAETKFRAALAIEPSSSQAALGLAQSLDAQHSPEAESAYRSYLATRPADDAVRVRTARLLFDQQKYDLALAELNTSGAEQSDSLDALRLRADIQIAQSQWDDAIATLQRAIALAPHDAQLIGGLGRTYLQKRNFPAAEKNLKAALTIDPNNLAYWKDLASTYYLSGNYAPALAAFDVVAKVETPGPGAWFVRALCYDKLHQIQPALDAYQKFLSMDESKDPDQVWQAQQRSKVLKRMLEEKRR